MDQFFADFDENDFEQEIGEAPIANYGQVEVEPSPEAKAEGEELRTIDRIGSFEVKDHPTQSKWKCIDDNIVIKETLGKGAFCKVKEAEIKVWIPGKTENGPEVEGT